jgi:hypothetical protein
MVTERIAELKLPRPNTQYSASGIGIHVTYIASPSIEMMAEWPNIQTTLRASMVEGYRIMAAKNLKLAEENMPIVLESWPQWE